MGKRWDKFLATVKGAAHTTKKQIVKTVDVTQQKNAIARKKRSLNELYVEIGTMLCTAYNDEELRLEATGLQSSIALKDRLAELIALEADFKDEIERMEKMLHWLQTHDQKEKEKKTAQAAQEAVEAEDVQEAEAVEEEPEKEMKKATKTTAKAKESISTEEEK